MAKLQSSFKNMALSLTCITLVAAAALGGIYMLTIEQINKQKAEAEVAAQQAVLCGDENGTAIKTEVDGFGGKMVVMVGFAEDGTILGYKILEHQETPGLGDKAGAWFQDTNKEKQNIVGRKATGNFTVSKDGGDVDAITAATISSRAFLKAINQAYTEFMAQKGISIECTTGATQMAADSTMCATPSCCQKEGCCEHQCNHECGNCEHQCEKACDKKCEHQCPNKGCCKKEMEAKQ